MAVGCVYLIHQVGSDKYKIGKSNDPRKRLFDIETSNSSKLELVFFTHHNNARVKEKWLQDKWGDFLVEEAKREWFLFPIETLAYVMNDFFDLSIEFLNSQILIATIGGQETAKDDLIEAKKYIELKKNAMQVKTAKHLAFVNKTQSNIISLQESTNKMLEEVNKTYLEMLVHNGIERGLFVIPSQEN